MYAVEPASGPHRPRARHRSDHRRTQQARRHPPAPLPLTDYGYAIEPGACGEAQLTRSKLERRFLALCRRHRLPIPEVNARVDRFEVDFFWPYPKLIVETDGYGSHRGRSAFEEDRARDLRLKLLAGLASW